MSRRQREITQISAHCPTCNTQRLFAGVPNGPALLTGTTDLRCQVCGCRATPKQYIKDLFRV